VFFAAYMTMSYVAVGLRQGLRLRQAPGHSWEGADFRPDVDIYCMRRGSHTHQQHLDLSLIWTGRASGYAYVLDDADNPDARHGNLDITSSDDRPHLKGGNVRATSPSYHRR
jgi:hypothetical protein